MTHSKPRRIIGIALSAGRLGFVVMDGDRVVLDHAVWDFAKSEHPTLWLKLERIVSLYRPEAAVLQDIGDPECELGMTSQMIICGLTAALRRTSIPVHTVSKDEVRQALGAAKKATKDDIAGLLARRFEELAHLRPHPRGVWRSEHRNMCRFVALGQADGFLSAFDGEDEEPEHPVNRDIAA